jgi:hypothetical protein
MLQNNVGKGTFGPIAALANARAVGRFSMIVRVFAVAAAAVIAAGSAAFALDHSTRDTSPRSPTELCCVDVALLPPNETSAASASHPLPDRVAPVTEVKTGLDGADWNCRRPDGSRRCFSSLRGQ